MHDLEQVRSRARQEVPDDRKICGLEHVRQDVQATASSSEAGRSYSTSLSSRSLFVHRRCRFLTFSEDKLTAYPLGLLRSRRETLYSSRRSLSGHRSRKLPIIFIVLSLSSSPRISSLLPVSSALTLCQVHHPVSPGQLREFPGGLPGSILAILRLSVSKSQRSGTQTTSCYSPV